MRTRRSKLSEDAVESDQAEKTNEDDGKTMKVDVIPEELASDALDNSPQNHSILETPKTLNPEDESCPNNGSASSKETLNDSLTNTIEDASDILEMETSLLMEETGVSETEQTLDDSVATPSLVCPEQSTTAEEVTTNTVEGCSNSLTVPIVPDQSHVNITEESTSSIMETEENVSNREETSKNSIDCDVTVKNTSDEVECVLENTESDPGSSGKCFDRGEEEEKLLHRDELNEKKAEFKIIGKKFCEERGISFPNHKKFSSIMFNLYRTQKCDIKHLEIALEEAAKKEPAGLASCSTDTPTTTEGKTDVNIVSGTEKEDKLPISSNNEIAESPGVPNARLNGIEQQFMRGEYRMFCIEYCKANKMCIPGLKRFKEMYHKLRVNDQLNRENFKIVLDKFGKEIESKVGTSKPDSKVETSKTENKVGTSKPENKSSSALLDVVEGEILPSIVKTLSEMTDEERVAFFDEFNALKAEMTPIAIKHCHTIKSPFPKKDFNLICRDLFAVGMLDEENVKLAVEMAFEEKCKGRLADFQLNLLLEHYCIDKGISSSRSRLKIDILPMVPKKFLNLKRYWELMYRLRRTNLFSDSKLAHPEAANLVDRRNDSKPSTAPSRAQESDKAKTAKPSTNLAVSTKRVRHRMRNRDRIRLANLPAKHARSGTKQKESTSRKALETSLEAKGFSKSDKRRIEGTGSSNIKSEAKRRKNLQAEGFSRSYEGRIDEIEIPSYQNPWPSFVNGPPHSKTRNDEKSIQDMLLQTKQWIAEKSRLLDGLETQDNVSRVESLSKRLNWTEKQNQQVNNRNLQVEPERFSRTRSRRERRMNPHKSLNEQEKLNIPPPQLLTGTMIFSQSRIPEPNFSAQNLVNPNFFAQNLVNPNFFAQNLVNPNFSAQNLVNPNFSAQNLLKPNFTPHSYIGEPGSSGSRWPVESSHLENIGHNRTEVSEEHYSRKSGFDEHSRNQGYGNHFLGREYNNLENIGHNRDGIPNYYSRSLDFDDHSRNPEYGRGFLGDKHGYDNPVAGTSRQDWSDGERFSSSRKNNNKWDDSKQGKNDHKRLREPVKTSRPIDPLLEGSVVFDKPTFRNNQELSSRKREGNDWRFVRDEPPQKKTRFVKDVQPKTSKSIDLHRAVNDFEDWMGNKNIGKLSVSMHSSNSSSRHLGRVSPQASSRNLGWASPPRFGGESRKPTVKESPPFIVPGKICKVAVVHEDYPKTKVTNEEAELIRNELWERIGVQSGVGPRFSDTYEEGGAVVFECEDQITVSWIWVNARTITPWRNARLRPTSWEKPPNEISIEIPRVLQSLTPEDLCQRLKNQNPGLSTKYWKFKLADETAPKGLELVFYIDDESMEKLKSSDLRPYLGFSRVKVHVIRE